MKDALGKDVQVGDYVAHMGCMYAGIEGSVLKVTKLTPKGVSGITYATQVYYEEEPGHPMRYATKACQGYTVINITKLLTEQEKF